MLKNMKVGAKLFAILVAPVVVLIILAVVGVMDRKQTADTASRVGELASFATATQNLAFQIEVEGVYSVAYMASNRQFGKDQLQEQRSKTDAAVAEYNEALSRYKPTEGVSGEVADELRRKERQVKQRLDSLTTNRRSVDDLQNNPINTTDQFHSAAADIVDFNHQVATSISEPTLAREFQIFVNAQQVTVARSRVVMIVAAVIQIGGFPVESGWPSVTRSVPEFCLPTDKNCPSLVARNAASDDEARAEAIYESLASAAQKQELRDVKAANSFDTINSRLADYVTGGRTEIRNDSTPPAPPELLNKVAAVEEGVKSIRDLNGAETKLLNGLKAKVNSLQSEAQRAMVLYVVGALGSIIIALILAYYVARATTVPLRRLTSAAYTLSTDKLPGLVERLRNPEEDQTSLREALTPIDINTKDEIGQLADAFNSIQQVTVEVAEEQAVLLRKGIGDIFINLARRNQTLLDRQIEFIDQLEANEEDPDQLDNLFKLDHLATRMRRNAESLLVLAGAEPPRRRGRPVALADVVRVAIGEVEDFARIQLLALDEATVGGNVAVDLAHLLSELMENATHFSPPDTMVEVVGHRAEGGSYIISISDQGIGMSAEQLAEANHQLAHPPLVGLALSRSLGFIVVGRLAQRFDISVKLTASPSGGVTALVTLPSDIVTYEGEEEPAISPPTEVSAPAEAPEEVIALDDEVVVLEDHGELEAEVEAVEGYAEASDDLLEELLEESAELDEVTTELTVPEGDEFDKGLQSLVSDELPAGPVESETPGAPPTEPEPETEPEPVAEAAPEPATVAVAEPEPEPQQQPQPTPVATPGLTVAEQIAASARSEAASAPLTAAGLVRRTPKKRAATAVGGGMPTAGVTRTTGQTHRSPEEVRKMLSRYRSGLNRGRSGADSNTTES
ncbi:MAG: nitrate- and nitrite sensing domain-containing protein [Acidimicrobiales bacterium]|nr:nitrate- and nitrite sensing domain-containing protein [Acidimicrobiales bacterium]